MPAWLANDPTVVFMLLATAALILGAFAWKTRKWKLGAAAGLCILLIVVIAIISSVVETDEEQIIKNLNTMARLGVKRDLDGVFRYFSNDFRVGSLDRAAFRQRCHDALNRHGVTDVVMWDFDMMEISPEKRTAKISFLIKIRGNWGGGAEYYRCEADFVREADNIWRMKGFALFNPFIESKQSIGLPF